MYHQDNFSHHRGKRYQPRMHQPLITEVLLIAVLFIRLNAPWPNKYLAVKGLNTTPATVFPVLPACSLKVWVVVSITRWIDSSLVGLYLQVAMMQKAGRQLRLQTEQGQESRQAHLVRVRLAEVSAEAIRHHLGNKTRPQYPAQQLPSQRLMAPHLKMSVTALQVVGLQRLFYRTDLIS